MVNFGPCFFLLFSSPNLSGRRLHTNFYTCCGLSAYLSPVYTIQLVSDIAIFVLKRDVKLQLTHTIQHVVKPVVKPVIQPVWQPVVSCKRGFRMPVWNVRLAGITTRKKSPWGHHRTTLSGYIFPSRPKACIDNRKKLLNNNIFPHKLSQYGERRPTNGWDRFEFGDCLEGQRESYQVCAVQYCVQQLYTVSCTHIWTELTVLWLGFVSLGPFHCA